MGCIRFENELARFTPINKFSWKNPQDYKDQLESCSTEPNITNRRSDRSRESYETDDDDDDDDDVEPNWIEESAGRPNDRYADGWANYWENSFRPGNNIPTSGEATPKPLSPPGPAKPQQHAPPPGHWNPWHKLSWRG